MRSLIHDILKTNITEDATYHRQEKDKCHEGTFKQLRSQLNDWFYGRSDSVQQCWWIVGLAAIGKSTMAVTIAQLLDDERPIVPCNPPTSALSLVLGAQFFINPQLDSNPHHIFPTIAAHLSNLSESVQIYLHDTIKTLVKKDAIHKLLTLSKYQAEVLFLRPLERLASELKGNVIVIILDGIDELHSDKRPSIGQKHEDPPAHFATILCTIANQLPTNVKVLVLSRPEHHIVRSLTTSINVLPFSLEGMMQDVNMFLTKIETDLKDMFPGQEWPSSDQINIIRNVAAGYIAIAKIAFLLVQTKCLKEGTAGGDAAFTMIAEVRYGDLYDFYLKLLSKVVPESSPPGFKQGCTFVLACLVFAQGQTIEYMQQGFQTKYPQYSFGVLHFFTLIRSIIFPNACQIDHDTVPAPHKSLLDYITSDQTPSPFRVDRDIDRADFPN